VLSRCRLRVVVGVKVMLRKLGRNVLLSVKPEFVSKILDGSKRWEFRRVLWNDISGKFVYVYASAPVKRVVARFQVSTVYAGITQEDLWRITCDRAGITQEQFYKYFGDLEKCSAVNITQLEVLREPFDPRSVDPSFKAPMNFRYISLDLGVALMFHFKKYGEIV